MTFAKLFKTGRSQAVRLPREFRFEGKAVRIRRLGHGVLLEPIETDFDALYAVLDRYKDIAFMSDGRDQPPPQERPALDDL